MHTEYTFKQETYFELQKNRLLFYGLLGFVGLAGVITFIILYIGLDYNKYLVLLLIPSMVLAGFGLLYFVMILVMIVKLRNSEVNFYYDFNDKYARIKTYTNGEITSDTELHYDYIYRYRVTKKVFFLYLANKKVFPLDANDPKLDEIKKLIKIEDIPVKKI